MSELIYWEIVSTAPDWYETGAFRIYPLIVTGTTVR